MRSQGLRIFSFILALHMLVAGMGVAIVDHFCFHKEKHDVSLFTQKPCCGKKKAENSSKTAFKKSKCCSVTSSVVSTTEFTVQKEKGTFQADWSYLSNRTFENYASFFATVLHTASFAEPPDLTGFPRRHVLLQVFLI